MVCTGKVVKATCAASASDYATICKQVSRGHKPDFFRAAECLSEYVRNYAGGTEKPLLLELDACVKSLAVVLPKPFRLRGWFVFLSPGRNLRCFGVGIVSAQHSRLQVSASRFKSLGAQGCFRHNRDKDMPKANNEPKPFRLRG